MNDDIIEYCQSQIDRDIVPTEAEKARKELLAETVQEDLINKNNKNRQKLQEKALHTQEKNTKTQKTNKQNVAKQRKTKRKR